MVNKTVNKLPKAQVDVTVSADWADVETIYNQVVERIAQETEIPGFRKGTAPLPMVENAASSKINDEFLKEAMPQLLVSALQEQNIIPIDYPRYQLISFTKGSPLSYKATVTERPVVKVGEYKTIKPQRPALKTVTDEEVNKIVEDLFRRWKMRNPAAQKAATPPSSTGTAGSMSFNQTQPANPQPTTSDAPDDNFAQAVGAQNLADLKVKIKTDLENEAKYNNELDYEESILQEVEKITQVEVPDILVEDELSRMLVSLQRRVSEMGLLMEDYLKTQNKTLEGLKAEWRDQALKNVRMELGLAEVARLENVNITDEELQAEIDKIQDQRLKAQFEQQEPRLHLRHSLRQIRTLDLLKKMVNPTV